MGHEKLHLVGQNAAVSQDEILPQRGRVRGVEQRHARLLGGSGTFAVIAGTAGRDQIHPAVLPAGAHGDNVLASEITLVELPPAIGADTAVTRKELAICQPRQQFVRVDIRHALGADDGVDVND